MARWRRNGTGDRLAQKRHRRQAGAEEAHRRQGGAEEGVPDAGSAEGRWAQAACEAALLKPSRMDAALWPLGRMR